MKFMKLGSKPDKFLTRGNVTSVSSDLESDIALVVDGHKFYLHKFPLLAKCGALRRLLMAAHDANEDEVKIFGFPGGVACFEMCAKFCYGVTITVNALNVGEVRSGAEFLEMAETVEKSNLIFKLEVFLNSAILRGWKDSIVCLQSSHKHMPWSEDLKIISRCIDSISSKVVADTSQVGWSFSYTRPVTTIDHVSASQAPSPPQGGGPRSCPWLSPAPNDWWVEDICDLEIGLYGRLMVAVKAKGVAHELVGEALRVYVLRWLRSASKEHAAGRGYGGGPAPDFAGTAMKRRLLLETIVGLLPAERGASSCSFLLKLLKAAAILRAAPEAKVELARRIGPQLEEAALRDLLIPSLAAHAGEPVYDVDLVTHIVEQYLLQGWSPPASPPEAEFAVSGRLAATAHGSRLKVAKLIDGYLAEIARDPSLPLAKFMQLAEAIPDFARPLHDGLYRAVDTYLKVHPGLTKGERKSICTLMDCRKLSMDACVHAAQNERLPLRTVVQVLISEQVRAAVAASGGFLPGDRALVRPRSCGGRSLRHSISGAPRPAWDSRR